MDSGNSSSIQSSNGGGEENCDSRADHSFSAFLINHHTSSSSSAAAAGRITTPPASLYHTGGSISDPYLPPPHHQLHLDPLISTYFTNLDTVWTSKTVRPGSDLTGPPSESVFFTDTTSLPHLVRPTTSDPVPISGDGGDDNNVNKKGNNNNNNNNNSNNNMARNPKKRPRASRRAPTTVLTTDTNNFRAMVQEFTGIPAPPFSGSSPFPRTGRLDLFGSSPNPSSFPLRPFAQKLTPPSSSSSSSSAIIASSSSSSLLNITNPFLNIYAPKDPLTDPSIFATKSKLLFDQSQSIRLGNSSLEEFGHFGSNFGGLQGIVSSSSTATLMHRNNSDAENIEADLLRSINGGVSESLHRAPPRFRASAAVSGSSPAPENNVAAARNEGKVESWICSSD